MDFPSEYPSLRMGQAIEIKIKTTTFFSRALPGGFIQLAIWPKVPSVYTL